MKQKLDAFYDAIISGAGIVGCGAAIRLAERGWRVLLIERHRSLPKHLAGELLHPPGVEQLRRLGVFEALLEASAQEVQGFAVFQNNDTLPIELRYSEIPDAYPHGLGLHHGAIVQALRDRARALPNVTFHNASVYDSVRRGERVVGVRLRERGGGRRAVYGRLVLAADGRHSRLRESFGIKAEKTFISFSVACALTNVTLPSPGFGHVFLNLPAPALAYPISDDTVRILFDVPAKTGSKLKTLVERVRKDYLPQLPPELREAVAAAMDRGDVQLAPNQWISTTRCTVPGAALIGDAAGCNHPLTASGMTSALNDVAELDTALDLADDLEQALAIFAHRHYKFARAREVLARALYDSFLGDRPGTKAICTGIFDYWSTSPQGRVWSMGLLSCNASQPMTFVREYLQVARVSVTSVLKGHAPFTGLRQRAGAILGVATESIDKMGWLISLFDHSSTASRGRKLGWLLNLFISDRDTETVEPSRRRMSIGRARQKHRARA